MEAVEGKHNQKQEATRNTATSSRDTPEGAIGLRPRDASGSVLKIRGRLIRADRQKAGESWGKVR